MEASSFLSMSINLRGKGLAPEVEPDGEAVADKAGDGARLLPALEVLVILRVAIGPSDCSLILEVETVLEGEVPVGGGGGGLTLMTPAATPPAKGNKTAPELTEGEEAAVVLGVFLALS